MSSAAENAGYSAGQAAKAIGLNYRTLDYWARTGLIKPTLGAAEGTGSARAYSFGDLVALKAAKRLRDDGISLQNIRKAIVAIRKMARTSEPLRDKYLMALDGDVVEVDGDRIRSWLKNPGQGLFLWLLDVEAVWKSVKMDVRDLQKPSRGPASQVA